MSDQGKPGSSISSELGKTDSPCMRRMIQDTLAKTIMENTKLMNNTIDQLSAILSTVDSERERLNAEIVSFEELKKLNQDESEAQIRHLSSQIESKDEMIKTLEQKINHANECIAEKDKVIESFKLQVNNVKECFEENEKAHSKLADEFKEIETKYYQKGKEMRSLVSTIGKLEVELSQTTESLQLVQSKVVTLSNDLSKKEGIIDQEKKKFMDLESKHLDYVQRSSAEISDLKERLIQGDLTYEKSFQEFTEKTYYYEKLLKDLQDEIDHIKEQNLDNINEIVSVSITRGKDGNIVVSTVRDEDEDEDGFSLVRARGLNPKSYSPEHGLVKISPHLNQATIYDTMVELINRRIDDDQFPIVEMGVDSNQNVHYIRTSSKFIATKLVLLTGQKFDGTDELIKITYVEDGIIPSCYTVIVPEEDDSQGDENQISGDESGLSSPKDDDSKSCSDEGSGSSSNSDDSSDREDQVSGKDSESLDHHSSDSEGEPKEPEIEETKSKESEKIGSEEIDSSIPKEIEQRENNQDEQHEVKPETDAQSTDEVKSETEEQQQREVKPEVVEQKQDEPKVKEDEQIDNQKQTLDEQKSDEGKQQDGDQIVDEPKPDGEDQKPVDDKPVEVEKENKEQEQTPSRPGSSASNESEDKAIIEKYEYVTLPSRCESCDGRHICRAICSITCYECNSETQGKGYNLIDVKNNTSSCDFCKFWVAHTSELAQRQITYGQFEKKTPSIESLQHGGLEFYLSRHSSYYHICGSRDGQWTYRGNKVLVRPHVYKGRTTEEVLSNFENKIVPKKDEDVTTGEGTSKKDKKGEKSKKTKKTKEVKKDSKSSEKKSPVVIIEEKIEDESDSGGSQGSVDITLLCDLDDSDLLDEINKDLSYFENTDEKTEEGSFDGGEFYDRKTVLATSAFGLHYKEGSRHVQTNLTTWFDSFCGNNWTMYKIRSGLGPRSVSMKCEIIGSTLCINHLGLFKMMSNIDGTLGIENEGLRSDLETIVPTLADVKIFMKWTKYQYSISTFSLDRMKRLFKGAFNSPQWSIGNVKCPAFNEKDGRINFAPKVYKARIFTYDPILANLTSITLDVNTYLSDSGVYNSVKLTLGLKETLVAARVNLVNVEHSSENKNGVILHHISTKNGTPLNQHAQKITIIDGTGSNVNYSSFGQICYPPGVKFVRVTGLFAFVATRGISSKPHTLTYAGLPDVLEEVSKEKFDQYLKHLADMRNYLKGPKVEILITKRQVFIDNMPVDDLKEYSSSSFATEYAMCKGCLYHPSNKNFCSVCRINFICAVNCGKHDGEVPSDVKGPPTQSSE